MTTASIQEAEWDQLDRTLDWIRNEPWWEYQELDPRRQSMLTASQMGIVMSGDSIKIHRLWQEKLKLVQPEDLSKVWAVVRGKVMEGPILHFYGMLSGNRVTRRQEFVVHPVHDWFACTLDGYDEVVKCPVEAKAPGGREPLEIIIERNQPQLQSQIEITGAHQCALVVSMGGSEIIVEYIPRDDEYIAELILRGAQFMQYVKTGVSPVDMPGIASPVVAFKSVDMTGNNLWSAEAATWLQTKASADACKDAEKTLKSMVSTDVRKAYGHGVVITRDRAGRMSLRTAAEARGRA